MGLGIVFMESQGLWAWNWNCGYRNFGCQPQALKRLDASSPLGVSDSSAKCKGSTTIPDEASSYAQNVASHRALNGNPTVLGIQNQGLLNLVHTELGIEALEHD